MEELKEYTYFQYMAAANYPVYLRVAVSDFHSELSGFLKTMNFTEVKGSGLTEVQSKLDTSVNARLLTMKLANAQVSRQIDEVTESDRYGLESITPKPGYRVYRYKRVGIVVYSFSATEWQLGCYHTFGRDEYSIESRIIINRYLSWALGSMGVVGFWGVPVEEGMAVMKRDESIGEAVFFDVKKETVLTMNGKSSIKGRYKVLRLDGHTKRDVRMSIEELMSFLSNNCTYIDYEGLTVPVRQSIQALTKVVEGVIHPRESFTPRTDLSL